MLLSFLLQVPTKIFINSVDEVLKYEQIPLAGTNIQFSDFVLVSMQSTKTDKSVRDLSMKQRKCIFANDVQLKYSKEPYTYSGCLRECKIDRAIEFCGCLPPFYVLSNFTACGLESLKCLKDERIWDVGKCEHCELACDFTVFSLEKVQKQ